jgi:hypothetical protein
MALAVASISQAADVGRYAVCRQGTSCDLFARWLASSKPAGKKNVRGERSRPRSLPTSRKAGFAKETQMIVALYLQGKKWSFVPDTLIPITRMMRLEVPDAAQLHLDEENPFVRFPCSKANPQGIIVTPAGLAWMADEIKTLNKNELLDKPDPNV